MHIADLSRYAVIVEYLPNYKRVKLDLQDQKDSSTPPQGDGLQTSRATTCLVQSKWRHFHPTIGWMDRWMYSQCDLDSTLGKGRKKRVEDFATL